MLSASGWYFNFLFLAVAWLSFFVKCILAGTLGNWKSPRHKFAVGISHGGSAGVKGAEILPRVVGTH